MSYCAWILSAPHCSQSLVPLLPSHQDAEDTDEGNADVRRDARDHLTHLLPHFLFLQMKKLRPREESDLPEATQPISGSVKLIQVSTQEGVK